MCELRGATAPLAPPSLVMARLRLPDVHTAHYRSRQIARSLIVRIAELMPPKWRREHRKKSRSNNAEHVTQSRATKKGLTPSHACGTRARLVDVLNRWREA